MSDQLLDIFKYAFLALLYLFFARVLWAVWSEVRGPRQGRVAVTSAPARGDARGDAPPVESAAATRARRGRNGEVGRLVVIKPKERKGAAFPIGTEITIGRAPNCTIMIPDDTFVSQLHARLFRNAEGAWVEDLGSTNGSYLNGARLSAAQQIDKGDRLQIGSTILEAQ
jgi:pSer/pThr/pTyr-binding forkhead associated (FHA) protein